MGKEHLIDRWRSTGLITDERLLQAFADIQREEFIPEEFRKMTYDDVPLPIGEEQTISQPTTVMLMLDALALKPTDMVLEIGTGSGYHAALLSKLCKQVYSLEIIAKLALAAGILLKKIGIVNVKIINLDGADGYPPTAPYDKIVVTAACKQMPDKLVEQLKEGGIILAPIGPERYQAMVRGVKHQGKLETESLGDFAFVPLTGKER